ncbi:glycosyltransferase family 2 protein [Candidatus Microgenomates bacterium]|nr:glycosyltransferase family 2 protein [Candidatus Microgenomates bacterium]
MKLSIIIVNWNTKDLLRDCIKSIISSKPKISYEIIIVDNGSTDGSIEMIEKMKNILLLKNNRNLGFAKANNQGMKKAKGDYIFLLNSDTKIKEDAIDEMYEFAESTLDAGVVGARLLNADGSIQPSCFHFPTILNVIKQYWFGAKGLTDKYFPKGNKPSLVDIVVGAAFLITPRARKNVGLLDEGYFFFFEDFDYCRRVNRSGLKTYYLPTAEIVHYHGSTVRKIVDNNNAWRNLIPGSKRYHGLIGHYIYNFILWSAQKVSNLLS